MLVYALTVFTGAFLLFQVQPLIGKYILPWFGGSPGVWTTCMLFFQVLLLGGYAYAHLSATYLKPRAQCLLHLVLLALALAMLPITPADTWKPGGEEEPTVRILLLLAVTLGLPYFVLSSTGPLVQEWFRHGYPGRQTYRLYALSNIGSLLALVSYPFYFESHFTRKAQASLWAWGLVVYAVSCAICAIWQRSRTQEPGADVQPLAEEDPAEPSALASRAKPSGVTYFLWLSLPACASVLLLATTNKMCQDVAVIPFLWVMPLALYLLSFIISFDSPRWYARYPFTLAFVAALVAIPWVLSEGAAASIEKQVGVYAGGLFICCMVCHGELYRLRPEPRHLTAFYLMIAAGGALGGFFVAIVAPRIFTDFHELHWGLFLCAFLFLLVCAQDASVPDAASQPPDAVPRGWVGRFIARWNCWQWMAFTLPLLAFGGLDWLIGQLSARANTIPKGYFIALRASMWISVALLGVNWIKRRNLATFRHWRFLACVWMGLGCVALAVALWPGRRSQATNWQLVHSSRNFYGMLTVFEHRLDEPEGRHFLLQHGCITHGLQFVAPSRREWATTYYGEESGIGLAVDALPPGERRIGLVGLGTGTLATYGRPGDYLRIYEINPEVTRLATTQFTYLSDCPAQVEIAQGDARLSMEREPSQQFDLLALDAFSGDAVPVHLLTREAFEIYDRHMSANGVIAVHISNRFLDLEPVIANLARHFHYRTAVIHFDAPEEKWWLYSSSWVLLSRNAETMQSADIAKAATPLKDGEFRVPLWTDDFASLFQIVK